MALEKKIIFIISLTFAFSSCSKFYFINDFKIEKCNSFLKKYKYNLKDYIPKKGSVSVYILESHNQNWEDSLILKRAMDSIIVINKLSTNKLVSKESNFNHSSRIAFKGYLIHYIVHKKEFEVILNYDDNKKVKFIVFNKYRYRNRD